ncbi:MAG: hypothetical protein A4E52_01017 [Pelotomaculum sp. PtaB.Bin013]|nr:MAG: hypothetical protein A4E52_01017 [Pelotomaculum sp. PtaB.Bin013]
MENAAKFQNGEIKILVATPAMASSLDITAGRLIIYHLPYSREILNRIINISKPEGQVYLFFGAADFDSNSSHLAALTPDRDCLARFYTVMRREADRYGRFIAEPYRIARLLTESGCPHVREYTVQVSIKVLSELGLLEAERTGEAIDVVLMLAPKGKQDLNSSQTYTNLQLLREESMAWMIKLLKDPLNNLF